MQYPAYHPDTNLQLIKGTIEFLDLQIPFTVSYLVTGEPDPEAGYSEENFKITALTLAGADSALAERILNESEMFYDEIMESLTYAYDDLMGQLAKW